MKLRPTPLRGVEEEFLTVSQEIPQRMPILELWLKTVRGHPFKGVTALFIQHQFGNQVPQARAMLELGLDPKKLFWLDVPYTSNARVRAAVAKIGIPRGNMLVSDDYMILDPYVPYQRRRTQEIVRAFLAEPPERLLVLDDGAYFLEAGSCFKKRLPQVAIVEQTTRGLIKLRNSAAMRCYAQDLPVVNVAESEPKRVLESPFIGRAVCAALLRKLRGRFSGNRRGRCLVLGFGAIGEQVVQSLSRCLGFQCSRITVHDKDGERLSAAARQGFSVWHKDDLATRFQLVVGCSGQASFSVDDHVYLEDGAVLASASSGSVELSREDFIELADSSKIDDIRILRRELNQEDIHSDIQFQMVDREVTFLNGGFPVNFEGQVNCIPHRYMQPTATMMVAAAVQAVRCDRRGVVPLDREFSRWLDKQFRRELRDDAANFFPSTARSSHRTVWGGAADVGL